MMKLVFLLFSIFIALTGCENCKRLDDNNTREYTVQKANSKYSIDADWNKPFWNEIVEQNLNYYMEEKPNHFPNVSFKITYIDDGLIIIFKVQDQYVRAVTEKKFPWPCLWR